MLRGGGRKRRSITAGDLPEGATEVPASMFEGRGDITDVVLHGVTVVRENAFYGCHNLMQVDMPALETVEDEGFAECKNLMSVVMPNVTVVEKKAFSRCINLERVNMPKLVRIGQSAFFGCEILNIVNIDKLTNIGPGAFSMCPKLECTTITSAHLPEGATEVQAGMFRGREDITAVVLPGVTVVGEYAFFNCDNLKNLDMPDLKTVNEGGFADCHNLKTIELLNLENVGINGFSNCYNLRNIRLMFPKNINSQAFDLRGRHNIHDRQISFLYEILATKLNKVDALLNKNLPTAVVNVLFFKSNCRDFYQCKVLRTCGEDNTYTTKLLEMPNLDITLTDLSGKQYKVNNIGQDLNKTLKDSVVFPNREGEWDVLLPINNPEEPPIKITCELVEGANSISVNPTNIKIKDVVVLLATGYLTLTKRWMVFWT